MHVFILFIHVPLAHSRCKCKMVHYAGREYGISSKNTSRGTSLMVLWLSILLATQQTRVQSLVGELRSHKTKQKERSGGMRTWTFHLPRKSQGGFLEEAAFRLVPASGIDLSGQCQGRELLCKEPEWQRPGVSSVGLQGPFWLWWALSNLG